MTTPSTERLIELAARCEAAEGPDRDLDLAIYMAEESIPAVCGGRLQREDRHPAYTASLDAAMGLITERWTAWQLRSRRRKTRFVAALSRLSDDVEDDYDEQEIVTHAATPALALTAAALRSLAEEGDGK